MPTNSRKEKTGPGVEELALSGTLSRFSRCVMLVLRSRKKLS